MTESRTDSKQYTPLNYVCGGYNEEDPIKNEGARVFITLYINFSDAQGHITPESVVWSGRNSNSSKLL